MKKITTLASAGITLATMAALTVPAYAWHPKGTIIKTVQNQTAGTAAADADTAAAAVSAAPGDTLVYSITVSNVGETDSKGWNDMANTVMTDTLPAGIELAGNPAQRTITENLGTIKPGKSVTKTYTVKVTSQTDGDVITNQACFTGNSTANDNPQSGCNPAVIKVHVPPVQPPQTPLPPVLPNTGSSSFTAALAVLGSLIVGYAVNTLRLKRQRNR